MRGFRTIGHVVIQPETLRDFNGRSSRYKHAARHFQECTGLAPLIPEFGQHETHEAFVARMCGRHGKKSSLWNFVP